MHVISSVGDSQRRYDNRAPGSIVEVLNSPPLNLICPSLLTTISVQCKEVSLYISEVTIAIGTQT